VTTQIEIDAIKQETGRRRGTAAGLLLSVAGTAILMGIITAEALYPAAYRTSTNTISDLGGSRRPDSVVLQPSAAIFDITMILTGLLIIAGAYLVRRVVARPVTVPLPLLGIGVLGVGVFPGTQPHPLFAMLAFIAGGLAALLAVRVSHGAFRNLTAVVGVVALGSLVVATLWIDWKPVAELGEGGIERWIAYPVVLWLVSFGGYLMGMTSKKRQEA
jgi:hypothetical membrane protein